MDHKQTSEEELIEMLRHVNLPEDSGVLEQCIYIVPPKTREVNPKVFTPSVVSIGPIHNPRKSGNILKPMEKGNILERMEDLKLKYFKAFLSRTTVSIEQFNLKMEELGTKITRCYPWPSDCYHNDFLKIILIDACFIIELFLRSYKFGHWSYKGDPILLKPGLANDILSDLILLENQLPFFLLEEIYNFAGMNIEPPSFVEITFHYFKFYNFPNMNHKGVCPKHFTDLLRTFLLPSSFGEGTRGIAEDIDHLYSASQLLEAGLVFEAFPENKSLLDLEFQEGVLTMPCFLFDGTTKRYISNIVVFEECQYYGKQYIAQYLHILDFLMNTEKDVNILVEKKIIVNWVGDAEQVMNSFCDDVTLQYFDPKFVSICKNLNGFYENPRNKYKAIFIHEYFNTPWKIASTIAAVLLLLFTLIQTVCSIISIIRGK